ncbi:DUF2382 domain-containing protein [Geodermatophilus obscurus]|uniref:Uncharacterized protein n=1 Tax=Geodermatophilus obscurus (strain ATCC 25078 / DSM 43160 / JCM 3152 / CCUG 61914 / KCC A-0152 / KCTC 9177 / NBRC 13315 / NRRL B-3577 / G-20) TaxID=526225 RepID=D2S6Z3_GEOOG|nr:PRC and DUF2382 domain-containing protein [Geodermatophilus obscurus]ADB77485.1 Domain of unknown function DUF2382-like protein [Geodermatophilus obscurus DSM 43160]
MIGTEAISRVIGKDVYDQSGDKIGSASEVYLDDESGQPEWVTVRTGLFGTKESFVPIRDADLTDDGLRVPVSKSQVKDAPKVDTDGHLSPQEEQELYRYYGMQVGQGQVGQGTQTDTTVGRVDRDQQAVMDPSTTTGTAGMTGSGGDRDVIDPTTTTETSGGSGTDRDRDVIDPTTTTGTTGTAGMSAGAAGAGMAAGTSGRTDRDRDGRADHTGEAGIVGRDVSGPTTDNAMTRSEERLDVGTRSEEVGRARLRKYVVTENVTETVPVSREEVRVEREPITDANVGNAMDGPAISEEEHEVTLHAERPVVEKEAVPVERVRLDKQTVTDQERVSEDVRKEQVEVDDGTGVAGNALDRDNDGRIGR